MRKITEAPHRRRSVLHHMSKAEWARLPRPQWGTDARAYGGQTLFVATPRRPSKRKNGQSSRLKSKSASGTRREDGSIMFKIQGGRACKTKHDSRIPHQQVNRIRVPRFKEATIHSLFQVEGNRNGRSIPLNIEVRKSQVSRGRQG